MRYQAIYQIQDRAFSTATRPTNSMYFPIIKTAREIPPHWQLLSFITICNILYLKDYIIIHYFTHAVPFNTPVLDNAAVMTLIKIIPTITELNNLTTTQPIAIPVPYAQGELQKNPSRQNTKIAPKICPITNVLISPEYLPIA